MSTLIPRSYTVYSVTNKSQDELFSTTKSLNYKKSKKKLLLYDYSNIILVILLSYIPGMRTRSSAKNHHQIIRLLDYTVFTAV